MDNRGDERRNRPSPRPEGRSEFSGGRGARGEQKPGTPARGRKPESGRSGPGRSPQPDRQGRPPYADRPGHPERGDRPHGDRPRNRELAAVQDVDEELLRLIMRRARLLAKLRTGDRLAPALEKALRTAWEEKAARLTRDSRLARDLFQLLQAVEPLSRVEEEQAFFNLAPVQKPVDVKLPAPADSRAARCWLALAAASGQTTALEGVPLSDGLIEGIKALNQMGGQLWWEEDGAVLSRGGAGLQRNMDKVIHVGDDPLNLWLALAFSLGMPTRLKLMGGSPLRFLDLAPVRHFLPELSARLTNVVPGQDGLPVRLECSGMVPSDVLLPGDLPADFIPALLLASVFWERPTRFTLPADGPAARPPLLDTVLAVLHEAGAAVVRADRVITVTPGPLALPEHAPLPMDTVLAASLLALPMLSGGCVQLRGRWGTDARAGLAARLLGLTGLELSLTGQEARSSRGENAPPQAPDADLLQTLGRDAPDLLPLATVLAVVAARNGATVALPDLPGMGPENDSIHVLNGFLERLGMVRAEDGALSPAPEAAEDASAGPSIPSIPWISPTAPWAVALALGAFLRPNLHLSNPGILTSLFPAFWNLYNTLPTPELSRKKPEPVDEKPARRRIIAQGVYGELPPDPPAGDDY